MQDGIYKISGECGCYTIEAKVIAGSINCFLITSDDVNWPGNRQRTKLGVCEFAAMCRALFGRTWTDTLDAAQASIEAHVEAGAENAEVANV